MIDKAQTNKKLKESKRARDSEGSQPSVEAINDEMKKIKRGFTNFFKSQAGSADKKSKDLIVKAKEMKGNSLQLSAGKNQSDNLSRGSSAEGSSTQGKPVRGGSSASKANET